MIFQNTCAFVNVQNPCYSLFFEDFEHPHFSFLFLSLFFFFFFSQTWKLAINSERSIFNSTERKERKGKEGNKEKKGGGKERKGKERKGKEERRKGGGKEGFVDQK